MVGPVGGAGRRARRLHLGQLAPVGEPFGLNLIEAVPALGGVGLAERDLSPIDNCESAAGAGMDEIGRFTFGAGHGKCPKAFCWTVQQNSRAFGRTSSRGKVCLT